MGEEDDVLDDVGGAPMPPQLGDAILAPFMMPGMGNYKAMKAGRRGKLDDNDAKFQKQKQLEATESRLKQHLAKISARIQASAPKVFRLEQLCDALSLGNFERSCILHLLQDVIMPNQANPNTRVSSRDTAVMIGTLVRYCYYSYFLY